MPNKKENILDVGRGLGVIATGIASTIKYIAWDMLTKPQTVFEDETEMALLVPLLRSAVPVAYGLNNEIIKFDGRVDTIEAIIIGYAMFGFLDMAGVLVRIPGRESRKKKGKK